MAIYDFDQTGLDPQNRITNETHVINSINGTDKNYVVPRNAPFFKESVVVTDFDSSRTLVEGIDYTFGHKFKEAEDTMARNIYGSIVFLNSAFTGRLTITYQTLGGDYVTSITQAISNGIAALSSLTNVLWEDLTNVPDTFPVTDHEHVVSGIEGVKEFLDELALIRAAIANPFNDFKLDDVSDLDPQFITPLMSRLTGIEQAIIGRNFSNALYFEQASIVGVPTEVDLGGKTGGQWFDLPLELTVSATGTYDVNWSIPSHFANTASANGGAHVPFTTALRYLVDDGLVTESHRNGGAVSLTAGMVLKLQARVSATTTEFLAAPEHEELVFKAVRIGN